MKFMKVSNLKYKMSNDIGGFSAVDILLAAALLGMIVTAMVGALIFGEESTRVAGARGRAVGIAEGGLEATRNIRDHSFGNLINGTYGLVIAGGVWTFSGSSDLTDIFTRSVTISDSTVSASFKLVSSSVTWQQTLQRTGAVELKTEITNWRSSSGTPTSCVTYCQSFGTYQSGVCRASPAACTANSEVNESGGDAFCTAGVLDTCCCKL
jgi:Tfp pilus assembly protein PilV